MGKDISPRKRNSIIIKAQGYINQTTGKIVHRGLWALMKDLNDSGLKVGKSTVKRFLTEFRRQSKRNSSIFEFPNKRKGRCGRKSKLTQAVKDVYKEGVL